MSDRYREGDALDKHGLFQLVTDEVFRDGLLEDHEKQLLKVLATFLRLGSEEAREISRVSKQKFREGQLGESGRLDPGRLYQRVLAFVVSDGEIDELEEQMLRGLRQLLGITDQDHQELLASPDPGEDPPDPASTGEPRDRFRLRVGEGRRRDQLWEDQRWSRLAGGARPGMTQVWGQLLDAMPPGPVEALEQALRTVERGVEHENCTLGDVAAVLRLGTVARILRRREWGLGATLWMGEDRHFRVMRTLTNVLLELHSRRPEGPVVEALDLLLYGLWRDLIYAVRGDEQSVVEELTRALSLACRVAVGQELSQLGATVLPPLIEFAELFGGASVAALGRLRQETLQLASVRIPTTCPVTRIHFDLEFLERERSLLFAAARAAGGVDRKPLDEYFEVCRSSVEEQGAPWEAFRAGFFGVTVLPRVMGLDQPVIVVTGAGEARDIREQFKCFRLEFFSRRQQTGDVLLALDVGPEAETRTLFPPVPGAEATAFQEALHRSQGRYLVLLTDLRLRPLRAFEQVGDLELSGRWGEAFALLGQRDAEAEGAFTDLLSEFPWLSSAHLHLGLIAKRQGDLARARRCFERALEVHPELPVAQTRLGVLAKQAGDLEGAADRLERSLAVDPTQTDALPTLASIHLSLAQEDPRQMTGWIYDTTSLHALAGGGPDLAGLRNALVQSGVPESLFGHLGILPTDPLGYG